MKKSLPVPTPAELEILHVLWRLGQATVRQTYNALVVDRDDERVYSTTLKMMQIMTEKELVVRDDSVRPQLYRAAQPREAVEGQMLSDLKERAFGGSASRLVLRALAAEKISTKDLGRIEELLAKMERGR
ncbi:MAG TPA: BlaI/MecI/CopY family transcriptional regulator [Thermoanaerobaculia bacterium]|nr:BlaI/MecI/CopY family transcriptional regulator [Thermoanaerobaculia bacterium]